MKNRKITAIILLICMCLSMCIAMTGCKGGKDDDIVIDSTKTQLYVRYFAGGLGTAWIEELCANFERDFANVSFEEGKKGVQIIPKFEKTQITADAISNNNSDVFFMEHMSYTDAVNKEFLLPITDIVKDYAVTGYNGEGEYNPANLIKETEKTIEEKLYDTSKAYFNIEGEYYATPFYNALHQMVYNVELFDTYNLYFNAASDNELSFFDDMDLPDAKQMATEDEWFVSNATDAKSKGPDGLAGTYDDGLPATYGQLWVLMERMLKVANITPFIFQQGYADHYFCAWEKDIWANSEGAEQIKLNLSWNGVANNLLNADGKTTYSANITAENAYLLQNQKGRLDALNFYDMLLSNDAYVYEKSWDGSFTHLQAQRYFVKAGQEGNYIDMKYGILMDGTWWNSESKEAFSNNSFLTRKFGVMPIPRPDSSTVGQTNADGTHLTQVDCYDSNIYIKANIAEERKEVAKIFVSYASSNAALNTFTKHTQAFRAMDYDLSDETLANMTYYGKSAYAAFKDTSVVAWLPTTEVTQNNLSVMGYRMYAVTNGVSDGTSTLSALKKLDFNLNHLFTSPNDYFSRTAQYYKNNWTTLVELDNK